MRLFRLVRDVDHSGVSGTGAVAEGVQFSDGRCALRWRSPLSSVAVYDRVDDIEKIHGHNGATRVVFHDPSEPAPEPTVEVLVVPPEHSKAVCLDCLRCFPEDGTYVHVAGRSGYFWCHGCAAKRLLEIPR